MAGKLHALCADRVEDGSVVTMWTLSGKFDLHPAAGDADVTLDFSMTSLAFCHFRTASHNSVIICTTFLYSLLQITPTSSMAICIRCQKEFQCYNNCQIYEVSQISTSFLKHITCFLSYIFYPWRRQYRPKHVALLSIVQNNKFSSLTVNTNRHSSITSTTGWIPSQ